MRGSLSAGSVEEILGRADESRSVEELCNFSCWSSHTQFRRLLEEAVRALDSSGFELGNCMASLRYVNNDMTQLMQALGSPRGVFIAGGGTNPMLPNRRYEMTEVSSNEWTIREWFLDGFAPYAEFCAFVAATVQSDPHLLRSSGCRGGRGAMPVPR